MARFNKKLSQLEAVYQIAPPIVEVADPVQISDYIHHMFENKNEYGIESEELDKVWFVEFSGRNKNNASKFVHTALQESGFMISKQSILEGIEVFNQGFKYEE